MSDLARVFDKIALATTYRQLLDAQLTAQSDDDRQAADDDLAHFIRMLAAGRIQEWFASRQEPSS